MDNNVPVLAIDGPTASGKGAVALAVAHALGFHYLDSGAFYRIVAWLGLQNKVSTQDLDALATLARNMPCQFVGDKIFCYNEDVSKAIRQEEVGAFASQIATWPQIRNNLQHHFRVCARLPGLVADGRDMGAVVFVRARLKVFLTATPEVRAKRRAQQLGLNPEKLVDADKMSEVLTDLRARDARDSARALAPLAKAEDARALDSSNLSITEVVRTIVSWWQKT